MYTPSLLILTNHCHKLFIHSFAFMKMKLFTLTIFLLLSVVNLSKAQNMIYFMGGEVQEGPIVEIGEKVKYKDSRGVTRSIDSDKVIMVINKRGDLLVISELNMMNAGPRGETIQKFLAGIEVPNTENKTHFLIKKFSVDTPTPITVIKVDTIQVDNEEVINYLTDKGDVASTPKNELLGVFYRDGSHKLISEAEMIANYIPEIRMALDKAKTEKATTEPLPSGPITSVTLTPEQVSSFQTKGELKMRQFIDYLNVIVDKNRDGDARDNAIDLACKLFLKSATMEVSSVNRPKTIKKTIRTYLNELKMTSYDQVTISVGSMAYVRDLTEQPDGTYEGEIEFEQEFSGEKNGKEAYSDLTRKRGKVKVERNNNFVDGKIQKEWDVFLGSIKVVATQKKE